MADATVVETKFGSVQGTDEGTVRVWRGIPFAAPPVGALRFRPPQPTEPWLGIRNATEFGPICPQPPSPMVAMFDAHPYPQSEDCLSLNVWSPAADDARRPVMVWIHGGAFVGGSGRAPWYDATHFVEHGDVVVVTLNYRLGFLGFLHLAELGGEAYASSGNCGMLDQVAALEWVRDNIAAFGGDPARVTIFGESAGGMSVGTLLGMPAAHGLFARAIPQSGAAHTVQTQDGATATALSLLAELELSRDALSRLHDVPVEALIAAQAKLSTQETQGGGLIAQPVVDGVSLPQVPIDAVRAGSAAGVSLLVGTNRDEMTLFTVFNPQMAEAEALEQSVAGQIGEDQVHQLVGSYAAANPEASKHDVLVDIMTDRIFRVPAIRLAEAMAAQGSAAYMYRFDWPTPIFGGKLGATHALEIPFVFDNLEAPGASQFTGDSPARQELADRMHAAWIAFARNGDPGTAGLPAWPEYDTNSRTTMIFNDDCYVEGDPQGAERRAWTGLL